MRDPRTASPIPQQHQLPLSHRVGRQTRQADDLWPQADREDSCWSHSPGPLSGAGYLLPQRPSPGVSYERLPQRPTASTNAEWPVGGGSSTPGCEVNSGPSLAVPATTSLLVSPRGRAMYTAHEDMLFARAAGGTRASASTDRGVERDASGLRNRYGDADPGVVMRDNSRCRAHVGADLGHQTGNPQHTPPRYQPRPVTEEPSSCRAGVMPVFASAPVVYHDVAQQCEPCSLERNVQELQQLNAELDRRLDEDGLKFLEALASYENEVDVLSRQNRELVEERAKSEEQLLRQADSGEVHASNLRTEHEIECERQDMLNQMDAFEQEKDEELRLVQETIDRLSRQLEDQERHFQRLLSQAERDRDATLQAMTDEGEELQTRIDKLSKDKEELRLELAKALARVDVANTLNNTIDTSRGGVNGTTTFSRKEASNQLRSVVGEREALKDDVTNKEGQIVLLKSQLEIADRKLRLTDMENAMLKSEIEVSRRGAPARSGSAVVPTPGLAQIPREQGGDNVVSQLSR